MMKLLYIAACVVVPVVWGLLVYKISQPLERLLAKRKQTDSEAAEYMI